MTALIEKEVRGCEATTGIKLFAGSANFTQVSGLTDADTQNAVPTHHLSQYIYLIMAAHCMHDSEM